MFELNLIEKSAGKESGTANVNAPINGYICGAGVGI